MQEGRFLYREGLRVPPHLYLSKGLNKHRVAYRVAKRLAHSGIIVNNNVSATQSGLQAEVLALTNPDDCLLISFRNNSVRRYSSGGLFDDKYVSVRNGLQEYLPLVAYEPLGEGVAITEELAHGDALQLASTDQIEATVNELVSALSALTRDQLASENAQSSGTELSRAVLVDRLLRTTCWTPAHGDLRPENILIGERADTRIRVIDLSHLGYQPFWYDAMRLTVTAGRGLLGAGAFDETLKGLFDAGGVRMPRVDQCRAELVEIYSRYRAFVGAKRSRSVKDLDDTRRHGWWEQETIT